ncbi:MAG TPA: AMP-binding protein, partial [Burkholderiales bacterium]|nr:AMP-binding protein [Burkholderiales bacterium]
MIRTLLRGLVRVALRVRVRGDLAALEGGRRLIVANHDSLIDGVLLGLFLPGRPTVVVTPQVVRHPLARLFRGTVRFVVLDPARPLALKRLIRQVQRGESVAIFPQGRPTTTGGTMKVYDSAGLIAARTGAHIVPVHIAGTLHSRFSVVGGDFPRRWFPRVVLTVQPAITLPLPEAGQARNRRRLLSDMMLTVMRHMMFDARPSQTLFEAFLDAAELHGRSTKIIEDARERPESYGEVLKTTLAMARLATRITAEREIVGIMLPNLSATVALVLGLTAMRRSAAMLNYSAGPEAMYAACVAAGVKTVITSRQFIRVAGLEANLQALAGIELLYVEDLRGQLTLGDKLWLIGRALPRPRSVLPPSDPSDVAIVLFTSGSESRPKGVAISHDAMLACVAQLRAVIDFGPNDKYFNALPMYHTYGLTACTLMPLFTGTRLFLYTTPLHYRLIPEFAYTR